jgi:hypothetical protein
MRINKFKQTNNKSARFDRFESNDKTFVRFDAVTGRALGRRRACAVVVFGSIVDQFFA